MWHGWYMERSHPTAPVMPRLRSRQCGMSLAQLSRGPHQQVGKKSILQAAGSCSCKSIQEVWWD